VLYATAQDEIEFDYMGEFAVKFKIALGYETGA
jgi:hypothetical protein